MPEPVPASTLLPEPGSFRLPHLPQGSRILVVEDAYLAADGLREGLEEAGVEVLGPVPSVAQAMDLLDAGARPDAAVLDLNLGEERLWPVADRLRGLGVPFVFATGYDAHASPEAYRATPRCEKPYDATHCLGMPSKHGY